MDDVETLILDVDDLTRVLDDVGLDLSLIHI